MLTGNGSTHVQYNVTHCMKKAFENKMTSHLSQFVHQWLNKQYNQVQLLLFFVSDTNYEAIKGLGG